MGANLKGGMVLVFLLGVAAYCLAEEMTLTTYYPSPRGVYDQLRVTGNLGIGTNDPLAKLDVNGTLRITDGSQASGRVLTSDANGLASWQPGVPTGGVMFFNLPACPAGWSALANSTGRYVVGGPAGVAVGTPLSSGENRPVGQHTHGITDPGHKHMMDNIQAGTNVNGSGVMTKGADYSIDLNLTMNTMGTGITINNPAGSVAGTNAPYLQLLVCSRD
jgi:hypothetical protein